MFDDERRVIKPLEIFEINTYLDPGSMLVRTVRVSDEFSLNLVYAYEDMNGVKYPTSGDAAKVNNRILALAEREGRVIRGQIPQKIEIPPVIKVDLLSK